MGTPSQFASLLPSAPKGVREPGTARDAMVTIPKTLDQQSDVGAVRRQLVDDHVHIVLIVDEHRRLLTTITRSDLSSSVPDSARAVDVGRLAGRTTRASMPISDVTSQLDRTGERRMAVTDNQGRLLGLLCLKQSRRGYCSDDGVAARVHDIGRPRILP
ncbi:hypothetical protein GCM10023175_65190 [Pseudonocardia xishanensis]|uniref:CBS domain-containing protein n=1 Tax=Pseudonocardia xishanensis TaxID=630995 RepID=A0ABP8S1Z4_9PSEU